MNNTPTIQLMLLLSDYVPITDGDKILAISPEAKELTRQKLISDLTEQMEEWSSEDVEWQTENIALLENMTDETFQAVLNESMLLTELQIGSSVFEPLTEKQLETLAEKLGLAQKKSEETAEKDKTLSSSENSPIQKFLKHFRK